jgi:dipeptidyl aminopeptidase/acylaminoacyl peptidase
MRRQYLKLAVLIIAGTVASGPLAQAQGQAGKWTPELALKVKTISNVAVSPDGQQVAFQAATSFTEGERSEWVSQIYVADADGSRAFQLTRGEKSSSQPAWSPDGRWIGFISARSGKANVWRAPVFGGESEQLTDEKGGVSAFRWSPDGRSITFAMTDPKTEAEEKADKEKNDALVVDENLKQVRLYLAPVEPDSTGKRTARKLTTGDYSVSEFDWSPDGKAIVFSHTPSTKADDWTRSDVSTVDVASGKTQPLAATRAAESQPVYSPDGQWIALSISDDPPTWGFTTRVYLVPPAGGTPKPLAESFDRQPQIVGWTPDGKRVLIEETQRTINRLSALPVDGGPEVDLSLPGVMVSGPNINRIPKAPAPEPVAAAAAGGPPPERGARGRRAEFVEGAPGPRIKAMVGFVSESADRAPEVYLTPAESFKPVQVSHVQDLPAIPVGRTEVAAWQAPDGKSIEGLLTYPVGYQPGTRVPLLVIVHGGPTGVFVQSFIASRGAYPIAAFASEGYAVLRCNVRGSSGYGREFRYANYGDWGGADYQDIMSGVDALIQRGVADSTRLGVMGWSYGGYMTSWIVTQTKRFKAASVGAGVTNLMSFTGTSDIPGFLPDYFGGEYWDVFDKWRAHSAMFNVKGVSTPTLIQHGGADQRVPTSQGYEFYNALKRQGVPVKMVVYPRQPHGLQEPKLQLDAMRRNLEWFGQWVLGRKAADSGSR